MSNNKKLFAVWSADGIILRSGRNDSVIIARSYNMSFVKNLYKNGALIVIEAKKETGCLDLNEVQKSFY